MRAAAGPRESPQGVRVQKASLLGQLRTAPHTTRVPCALVQLCLTRNEYPKGPQGEWAGLHRGPEPQVRVDPRSGPKRGMTKGLA